MNIGDLISSMVGLRPADPTADLVARTAGGTGAPQGAPAPTIPGQGAPPTGGPPPPQGGATGGLPGAVPPPDLSTLYSDLLRHQREDYDSQRNRSDVMSGLTMVAAGLSRNPTTRANLLNLAGQQPNLPSLSTPENVVQNVQKLREAALQSNIRAERIKALPAIAKKYGISPETAYQLFEGGKLDDFVANQEQLQRDQPFAVGNGQYTVFHPKSGTFDPLQGQRPYKPFKMDNGDGTFTIIDENNPPANFTPNGGAPAAAGGTAPAGNGGALSQGGPVITVGQYKLNPTEQESYKTYTNAGQAAQELKFTLGEMRRAYERSKDKIPWGRMAELEASGATMFPYIAEKLGLDPQTVEDMQLIMKNSNLMAGIRAKAISPRATNADLATAQRSIPNLGMNKDAFGEVLGEYDGMATRSIEAANEASKNSHSRGFIENMNKWHDERNKRPLRENAVEYKVVNGKRMFRMPDGQLYEE